MYAPQEKKEFKSLETLIDIEGTDNQPISVEPIKLTTYSKNKRDLPIVLKSDAVVIDNIIVNAAQNLLLSEKRILLLAAIKMNKLLIDNLDDTHRIQITAKEFYSSYAVHKNTAYKQLQCACEGLMDKKVSWYEQTEKGQAKISVGWIGYAKYEPQQALIELSFTQDMKKYLVHLTSNFTTYKLSQASALRSIYSLRLLEIISQFKTTGWRQLELSEFLMIMDAKSYEKRSFSDIRKRILDPALKELNEKEGMNIEYTTTKQGKKIISICFVFKEKLKGKASFLKESKKLLAEAYSL